MNLDSEVLASLDPAHLEEPSLPDMAIEDPDKSYFEGLFPKGGIHLIGGPSGSGKTTLVFQMYRALTSPPGSPHSTFLGRTTYPAAWAYISGDRTAAKVLETQNRIGVSFKVFSLVDEKLVGEDLLTRVFPRLPRFYGYRPNFVYIDGFTALCPNGDINNYKTVALWLAALQRFCEQKNLTLLGACHCTKTKQGEKFLNPRQRIAGSVAWAGFSDTVVIIEPPENDQNGNLRQVSLLPRNSAAQIVNMKFNEFGTLDPVGNSSGKKAADKFILDSLMAEKLGAGETIYYTRLWAMAQTKGCSRSTFDRWLAKSVEDGFLDRFKKGVYVRTSKPSA
jgi:energy-coupling factor transporter ATP-binding protein EcfA2